ncbi:MAG: zinc protease [Acidobacteriota bacterium]|jgi:zinc protease
MMPTLGRGLAPSRHVLDNGAVLIVQETAATPAVAINATFLAGSLYEPDHLTGLAYLTGRVIDRGTERRSADVIAEDLDERGVSLRIGTTRHTMTLSCTCLAEDFEDVLAIVIDVARRPTFPAPELAKRRGEAITALRQDEDNPAVRAVETLFELLYGASHPYGRRAKGTPASLESIDRDAIAGFHRRHVRPATLSLAIVGDVDDRQATEAAAAALDGWRHSERLPNVVPPPAGGSGRRLRTIGMPGKAQSDIAYGFTTISRLDPRYYAYWMMNNVLGQFGLGGRLADNIRERQGMAYYTYSTFDATTGESPLVIRAGVDPKDVERALDAIDAEVQQLGAEGPTTTELEETRQFLIGSIPRLLETNHSIATFLQTCERFGLGLHFDQQLPALLEGVTIDEVRAAAADVLHADRAAVSIAGPKPLPEARA